MSKILQNNDKEQGVTSGSDLPAQSRREQREQGRELAEISHLDTASRMGKTLQKIRTENLPSVTHLALF